MQAGCRCDPVPLPTCDSTATMGERAGALREPRPRLPAQLIRFTSTRDASVHCYSTNNAPLINCVSEGLQLPSAQAGW